MVFGWLAIPPQGDGYGLGPADLGDPLNQISYGHSFGARPDRGEDLRPAAASMVALAKIRREFSKFAQSGFRPSCTGGLRALVIGHTLYMRNRSRRFFRHTHSQSWGRTGFDGDMKAVVARRVALTRKTGALRNLPADNNGYALAA